MKQTRIVKSKPAPRPSPQTGPDSYVSPSGRPMKL